MNLQSVLNYRTHCIVCGKLLRLKNLNNPRLKCFDTEDGLKIRSGHVKGVSMIFNFDGTYERGKKDYPAIYNTNIFMTKICPDCHTLNPGNPHYIYLKGRSAGFPTSMISPYVTFENSSIKSTKTKCCQYTFALIPNRDAGTFTAELTGEHIRYYNDEMFCHVDTAFDKNTLVYRGNFADTMDKMLRLSVPPIDLSTISTLEQLHNKINVYNLFS